MSLQERINRDLEYFGSDVCEARLALGKEAPWVATPADGPFVSAVKDAVRHGVETWECFYYAGPHSDWARRRVNVYMETRASALGPEWRELQLCVIRMKVRQNNRKHGLPKRPS